MSLHPVPRVPVALLVAAPLLLLTGCKAASPSQGGGAPLEPPPAAAPPAPSPEELLAQGQELFTTRCAPCHGPDGRGDGPSSATLEPKPRDFHDKDWQAGVTDDHIEKTMQYGGAAVGKSASMPSNPDLSAQPESIAALRTFIRHLGTTP